MIRPYVSPLKTSRFDMPDRKVRKWYTCGRMHYWPRDRRRRREERLAERKAARQYARREIERQLDADGMELRSGRVWSAS